MNDILIKENAVAFAKANKKDIVAKYTDLRKFPSDEYPVSVFMAGSPGAGKTEVSTSLLEELQLQIVRIDADELRSEFSDYNGANSNLFQAAVSLLVDEIHNKVLKQSQSFILDGTLSNYKKAELNIQRSVKRGRTVQILYVYQTPQQAWKFVTNRQRLEGRYIPPESFVDQYFKARENANELKRKFASDVRLDLLLKDIDGSTKLYKAGVDRIDNHIPEKYSREQVEDLIQQRKA